MTRMGMALLAAALLIGAAQAGPFGKGIGSAMIYGPYTGGHNYSYNVAYSYGFAFSSADTWRRDPFAYPAGVYPYRPYGQPILYRAFPKTDTPPISVPGDDGLPVLAHPGLPATSLGDPSAIVPNNTVNLQPVPGAVAAGSATVKVIVPAGAEVYLEKEKMPGEGSERLFASPPLEAGKMYIYTVRATWTDGGRNFDQVRVVGVKAGESAKVNFFDQR